MLRLIGLSLFVVACCGLSARAEEFASAQEMVALRGELAAMQQKLDQSLAAPANVAGCGCDACCAPTCCDCQCGCVCQGWRFSADYLFWKLYSDNLHFAWLDQNNQAVFGDAGLVDVDMNYDSGYRLRAAYQTCCGWELAGVYTHFHTSGSETVVDPDGAGPVRVLSTRLDIPGPNYDQATGNYDFDLNVFDFEFAKCVPIDCCTAVRLFGGFRYADIDQHLSAQYVFAGGTDTFDETVDARLYGVRAGTEGWWTFCSGLGLYGRFAGSVLTGTVHHRYVSEITAGGEDPFHNFSGAIPVLEAAAGVSYRYGAWELAAGYEASAWLGLSKSMRPMDDVDASRFSNEQFDLVLAGWTFHASYAY